MDFNTTWEALVNPGKADEYFDIQNIPRLQAKTAGYSHTTAWWLAEISRLIYNPDGQAREYFLENVGLHERVFVSRGGTQCAIIEQLLDDNDERVYVLVFRGTSEFNDWVTDLKVFPLEWCKGGRVHRGFAEALDQVWCDLNEFLNGIEGPVFYTGHSLGAALATLAASRRKPYGLYTFGSPRVGDRKFGKTLSGFNRFRIVNNRDVVTTVPPSIGPLKFCHIGELRYTTHRDKRPKEEGKSPVNSEFINEANNFRVGKNLRRFTDPPEFLSDHAPINYVAHLERQVKITEIA